MKEEIWKPVVDYENLYEVSNLGRVKSLNYRHTGKERVLKGMKNRYDYLQVILYKDNKGKTWTIHKLVAIAFLDNPNNLPVINHKDENKENNCVQNLEWCSVLHNNTYNDRAKKIGKKLSKAVFSVDKESGLIMWWQSAKEAEKCTGIPNQNICACCKGKLKSAGNHLWFYAEDDED